MHCHFHASQERNRRVEVNALKRGQWFTRKLKDAEATLRYCLLHYGIVFCNNRNRHAGEWYPEQVRSPAPSQAALPSLYLFVARRRRPGPIVRLIILFLLAGGTLAALPGPTAFVFGDRFMMAEFALFIRASVSSWHGYSVQLIACHPTWSAMSPLLNHCF